MFSQIARRSLLMVFVMAFFVFPGVAQAGVLELAALPSIDRFEDQVQSWAGLLWGVISGTWEKEGVSIDPNGTPGQNGSGTGTGSTSTTGGTTSGEGGGSIDPNGKP